MAPTGSKGRRFFKLAGMTASVVGNYARGRVQEIFRSAEEVAALRSLTHSRSGQRIAETLGELKGAVMKVGQMASIATELLPAEVSAALSVLQREAPPVPFEVIAGQVEAELGSPPERLFAHFDPEPFASASIGQVHRARLDDGREVAVKVQYPGVDASCDADLAQLKLALRASGLVRLPRRALDELFVELRRGLHEELDYCNEADNLRLLGEFHRRQPALVLPEVVGERSSQRVLTLTYEAGDPLGTLLERGYSQEQRDAVALNLFHMIASQLFELGALHADPNPANFAARPDGRLVIYDFGCVKRLRPEIVQAWRAAIGAAFAEDYAAVDQALLALGARNPAGPPVEPEYYKTWRDLLYVAFEPGQAFDYGASTLHQQAVSRWPGVVKRMSSFQPPVEAVLIDRAIVGHYGNLRNLGARVAFREPLDEYLARFDRGAGAESEP